MNTVSTAKLPVSLPTVAVVGTGLDQASRGNWHRLPHFDDAGHLVTSRFTAEAIVLAPADESQAVDWLYSLRRDERLGLKPLLLHRPFGLLATELSDGVATDTQTVVGCASEMAGRAISVSGLGVTTADERLLAFLYLRPGHTLTPLIDWHDTRICHYPLADVYCPPGTDGFELIDRLRRRGLLENTTLLERIHTCHRCGAGQLLFLDRCPQCGGIDIGDQNFLHCYACGNVATQQSFLRQEGLICPQCSARLRHIGVDYDRALETLCCASCAARFTEPDVKARCLECETISDPDALLQRRFYGLKLSPAGELAARTGHMDDVFKLVDELSHAHPEYFLQTLDWLIKVSRRHTEVQFGLVCLIFSNLRVLATELPRHRLTQLFDTFAERLHALIRSTDLFMREDDAHCWLLFPQTDPQGMQILLKRINKLGEGLVCDDRRIEFVVSTQISADITDPDIDARLLMSILREPV